MGQQINVNIRMDSEVKENADALFNELGFNLTTAINAFVKQALRERAIPFHIRAEIDTYFTGANMRHINQSLEDLKSGNIVVKTMRELEDMANE
ncbi:MAG: type II toxin-antitoxin system RelB/DinJ family antitoxin [Candidatus Adiutrix sp.]